MPLETQGLPAVIEFYGNRSLGAEGYAELNSDAWRNAASQIIADPSLLDREAVLWLPASDDLANAYGGDGHLDLQPLARQLADQGKLEDRLDLGFLARSDATDPQQVGIWGALKGSILTMIVTLAAGVPRRRAVRALPRGICPEEPLDRRDRGVDQQSRGGAFDHLRSARPGGVPRRCSPTCAPRR